MTTRFLRKTYPLFVILIAILLFFYPIIFSGKTFFFRDFHRFFYPLKYFLASSFSEHTIPFWCPNLFCGQPFASFVLNAVFYPLSVVFIIFSMPLSLNLFVILHFLLGFIFFYLFITAMGLSRKAAVLTGISYCYGSYTISAITVLNHLPTLIWMPAILWAFHLAITQKKTGHFILTIVFLCMALLAGAPQLLLITAGIMFLCALTWMPPGETGVHARIKNVCVLPWLMAFSVAIVAVQLGPMYFDYLNSIRLDGISYAEATEFSLKPAMLKHLLLPLVFPADFTTNPARLTDFFPGNGRIPWLLTIYPGFLILPLALVNTCFNFSKKHLVWMFAFALGVLLALGHHTPVYRVFFAVFPSFRFPEKFMAMASFSLLVMAAYGFDYLLAVCRKKGVPAMRLFIVLLLALTMDLYFSHRHLNPVCDKSFYRYHHPDLQAVLGDKGLHRIFVDTDITVPEGQYNTIQNTHIQWQKFLTPNIGVLNNLSHVGGASGMELKHQYFITELLLKPWPERINFLRLANVKYIISNNRLEQIPSLGKQLERINSMVYKVKDPLPRAWMVGKLQLAQKGVLDELTNPSFDMRHAALGWGDVVERHQGRWFKWVEKLEYTSDNAIDIELTADEPGILVLSESYYPGWRVWVDGVEKKCLKLNYLFQGVEIEKGKHRIVFVYRPKHFTLFLAISSVFLLLLLSWSGYAVLNRKKTERGFVIQ